MPLIDKRKLYQTLELESIAQTAHALMEQATYAECEFNSATHFEHVVPMFSLVWSPCLASFSMGLQNSDNDEYIWKKCLVGFRYGIRVACLFQQNTERDAYITALTQFTLINAKSPLHNMQPKNIECIKLLITLGDEDGNFLDKWWYDVLKCISQLELAQHIGTNRKESQTDFKNVFNIDEKSLNTLQTCLSDASSQSLAVAVDRIFTGSSKLTGEAIVHFVRALCKVSHEELAIPTRPQMSMLRKIVEISAYNMDRIRIEWSLIWNVLGDHFNIAGCNSKEEISNFALDALRQLSAKFLEKGELKNFRLQTEFLRPFETIMMKNKSPACHDFIVDCLNNLIKSHSGNIRSGWTNIFSVFTLAAAEQREEIVKKVFETTSEVLETVFKEKFVDVLDSFQEAIKCLSELACNSTFSKTSFDAIQLIKRAAALVSENTDQINKQNMDEDQNSHSSEMQKVWVKAWFPIIFQLSCVINRGRLDERTMSLNTMFTIINTYGNEFRTEWWNDLFKIIFRIFDFSKLNELGNEKNEWMLNTCTLALCSIVNVFTFEYDELAPNFLLNIYQQFELCVKHGNEELAKAAIECFENLVTSNGSKFEESMWEKTVDTIVNIFKSTTPDFKTTDPEIWNSVFSVPTNSSSESISIMPNGISPKKRPSEEESSAETNGTLSPGLIRRSTLDATQDLSVQNSSLTRCIVQLELVDKVSCILFGRNSFRVEGPVKRVLQNNTHQNEAPSPNSMNEDISSNSPMFEFIPVPLMLRIVQEMLKVHKIACEFNTNRELRTVLMKSSLKNRFKISDVQKQETHSIHCSLNLMFRLFAESKPETTEMSQFKGQLIEIATSALNYYLAIQSNQQRSSWVAVLQLIYNRLADLPETHFKELDVDFRRTMANIVKSEEQPIVREAVFRFLDRCIS
ncbi:hypothetical protein M3Y97_00419900 [Aphelenchoides bicaudatus]|nr:hypothetical protein M3Y97_00419900 [Aphelenchoides bicaudatus]